MAETVKFILDELNINSAFFVGHSMGAYPSLLLGKLNATSQFISTSPELFIGLKHSRSFENSVLGTGKYRDLETITDQFHNKKNGLTFFGAYDPIDCYFLAQDMVDKIGPIYEVPHHHGVTEYFTSNRIYTDILQASLDDPLWSKMEKRNFLFPKGTHGTKTQYLHFYDSYCAYLDHTDEDILRAKASTFSQWANPGWQEVRSKIWARLGEPSLALDAARLAYMRQPDLMQFIDIYGSTCLQYGEHTKLCDVIDSMSPAQREHPVGSRLLNKITEKLGKNFQVHLSASLEQSAPPLYSSALRHPSNVAPNLRPADAAQLYKLNVEKRFDEVLELTCPRQNPKFEFDSALAPARALALIYSGDRASGLRLLRELALRGAKGKYFARALITAGQKTRSIELLRLYLQLDFGIKWRKSFSKFLKPCLNFISSPNLIAKIIVELAHCQDESLESVLSDIQDDDLRYAVARLIPIHIDASSLKAKPRRIIGAFLNRANLSILAEVWTAEARPK